MSALTEFDIFGLSIFSSVVIILSACIIVNRMADKLYREKRKKASLAKMRLGDVEASEEIGRFSMAYAIFPAAIISILIGGFLENHLISTIILVALTAVSKLMLDSRKCWKCVKCGTRNDFIGSSGGYDFFRCKNGHMQKYRALRGEWHFSIGGFGVGHGSGGSGGFGGGSSGGGGAGR